MGLILDLVAGWYKLLCTSIRATLGCHCHTTCRDVSVVYSLDRFGLSRPSIDVRDILAARRVYNFLLDGRCQHRNASIDA